MRRREGFFLNKSLNKKVSQIIQQRNLHSIMNNTKWTELISSIIQEMPFPPAFVIKYLTSETKPSIDMMACHYYGDWTGENFPSVEYYFNIEWMKVQPRYYKHRGKLVSPEIVDGSKEFEAILDKCHIPYEIDNEVYCIYGYK